MSRMSPGDAALVAGALTRALRRKYERCLVEELRELGQVAVTPEAEARTWERVAAELRRAKEEGHPKMTLCA